jgi:hypothetical protein
MARKQPTRKTPAAWETLDAAARRLGRNAGHLRRLCPELKRQGFARFVKGGGQKRRWQLRADADLASVRGAAVPAERHPPILLTVGGATIRIRSSAAVTLTISPAANDGAGKRSEAPPEGASIDSL